MAKPYRLNQKDLVRRKRLNEEFNPRETVMNEATQTINPLTGKKYVATGEKYGDAQLPPEFVYHCRKDIIYLLNERKKLQSETTDFLEYQLALARKDVRDGKMSRFGYMLVVGRIRDLAQRMNEAKIPLSLISSPDGLDSALRDIEADRPNQNEGDYIKNKDLVSQLYYIFSPDKLSKNKIPLKLKEENLNYILPKGHSDYIILRKGDLH